MKKKGLFLFILFALCVNFLGLCFIREHKVYAQANSSTLVLNNDDKLLTDTYLDLYSIPNDFFSYSNNGGELTNNQLSKAFDKNFNTCFKSSQDNNVSYTENGVTKPNFINYIDITFNQNVEINRLLYGTENSGTTRGYPIQLNLYYYSNNEWVLIDNYVTNETSKMVLFDFGQTITTNKFRFEYEKVSTKHKYVATAREIILLQPEIFYDQFCSIFSDYAQTKLSDNFNTLSKLNTFEEQVKDNLNFNSAFKPILERAKKILFGNIGFDARRELSTNSTATNKIAQNGDILSYSRNVLKMSSFGTNRQVSGILVKPDEVLNVYVEADEGQPLPRIQFSQNYGHWSKWLSGERQLVRGKNTFIVPNLKNDRYTVETVSGGAVYIINPYASEQQNGSVKLYFEGGEFYPVYKKGDDENTFKKQLEEYVEKLTNNPNETLDICEIVSDHIIFSALASSANRIYKNFSPKQTTLNWDSYLEKLLTFGGVDFDEDAEYYNPMNKYINANVRVSQPFAGAAAYAASDHIGIYTSWETSGFYASGFGWGMSHELGHAFDIPERTIGETTNNMFSKFNETAIEKTATRGDFVQTLNALSSDLVDTSDYFNSNRYNYLIWWYIESYQKGFWGNLEKCYRGQNAKLATLLSDTTFQTSYTALNKTEKNVFLSSLVTGIDLSYYFERWGFNLSTSENVFNLENASESFKQCISKATTLNYISNTNKPKLWYQDTKQYNYVKEGSSYSFSDSCAIKKVFKSNDGISILLDTISSPNHLGYEILEGNETDGYKVIGFTYNNCFVDTNTYANDYTPTYKVRAFDRQFNCTNYSEKSTYETAQTNVCKIGETYFSSIADAVKTASDGDTIVLMKSTYEPNIVIDKNITITLSSTETQNLTIYKTEIGNLFTIQSGKTLALTGLQSNYVNIDGNNLTQNGCLFAVAGILETNFVNIQNSVNTQNGGAIEMKNGSITLNNTTLQNCSANNGGAIYCDYASSRMTLTNVLIQNTSSTANGSAVASKGTIRLENCTIDSCQAGQNGTIYNYAGGIVYLINSEIFDNYAENGAGLFLDGYTEITNSNIHNNTAINNGGAVYYSSTVSVRRVKISNSEITQNMAENGSSLYVNKGNIELLNTTINDGQINLYSGNLSVANSCDIKSQLVINNGGNMSIVGGLFTNIQNCVFTPLSPSQNMIILSASNYNFQEEDLNKILFNNASIDKQLSDNKVVLVLSQLTLTIQLDSSNITHNYNYGEKILLNFSLDQTHYIESYLDESSNTTYQMNSEIVITKNTTLKGLIKNKVKVMLNYKNSTETFYILPYEKFLLPYASTHIEQINYWTTQNASYKPNENIYPHQNTTLNAVYEHLFTVTLLGKNNEVINCLYTPYASEIKLPKIDDKSFDGWIYDNQKYTDKFIVYGDVTLNASYKSTDIFTLCLIAFFGFIFFVITVLLIKYIKSKKHKRKVFISKLG